MESMRRSRITDTKLSTRVHGNPVLAPGKIGQGLLLDGRGEYVDAGDLSDTCLGNLSRCQYGFTFGTWIIFNELLDNMYYFSSGAPNGVQLYHRTGRLYAEAQQDRSNWRASWPNVQTGKWYFVELSWSPDDGLRMFVDLDEVAHTETPTTRRPTEGDSGQLMIGRANSDMRRRRYGAAIFDEMEVWNANRDRLVELGFINRGEYGLKNVLLVKKTAWSLSGFCLGVLWRCYLEIHVLSARLLQCFHVGNVSVLGLDICEIVGQVLVGHVCRCNR